jgi:oligopeptide/dipeptide ABC transporter ATP-binding protein
MSQPSKAPLLEVRGLVQEFPVRGGGPLRRVHALSGVSFSVGLGETLALVGETGSGKSTTARATLLAPPPRSGQVFFRGQELTRLPRRELLRQRRYLQMVFQDPFDSIDPRWRVRDVVAEPLTAYRVGSAADRRKRVAEVLDLVGLDEGTYGDRRRRQLSGGQCQRVAIARALALSPALIICDEPVSSLDVLIQAQVINLLEELRRELGLSYLFIAHDLGVVKRVSDRVAVMYLGKIVEVGPTDSIYREPRHPYTAALLEASPRIERKATGSGPAIRSETPSALAPPSGCRFRTRCPRAQDRCARQEPELREHAPGHLAACHFPLEPAPPDAVTGTPRSGVSPNPL